jgi:hypothetical protein
MVFFFLQIFERELQRNVKERRWKRVTEFFQHRRPRGQTLRMALKSFKIKEVLKCFLQHLRQLLACTRGAGLQSLEDMVPKRFVLSVDDDTEFRS